MENKTKKLEEVISYITRKFSGLTRTQLVKLAYLIDRLFYENYKKNLTGIDYYMYFYGPYCDEFEEALDDMKSNNLIHEEFVGMGYKIYFNGSMSINLDNNEINVIENILKMAKEENLLLSAKNIKEYVYSLPEVDNAEPFTSINFKKIIQNKNR